MKQIGWSPPPQLWYKVNSHGSVMVDRGTAACGGIIRNHDSGFVGAWSANLGVCPNNSAKIWGAFWGLCFIKNNGLQKRAVGSRF